MFRWCAYCLRFMGQRAPFDDFAPTHGICGSCETGATMTKGDAIDRVRPLFAFHRDLLEVATNLSEDVALPTATELIQRGAALGIGPLDLSMGLLQPLLYEVGRLWGEGTLSHRAEARFTSLVDDLLEALLLDQQIRAPKTAGTPVILTAAVGNRHTVGIRMLGLSLREAGHDVRVVREAIACDSLLDLASLVHARIIGVSVSEPAQLDYVRDLRRGADERGLALRILVGGFAVRDVDVAALPTGVERLLSSESPDWERQP